MSEVYALLFAERVVQEAGSGRHTLVGVFDTIDLDDDRQASTPWFAFISVVDLPIGETTIELKIALHGIDRTEFQGRGHIQTPADHPPPVKVECGLPINLFQPSPGQYDVSLVLDGEADVYR